jgi:S1-C subfamily serine protease
MKTIIKKILILIVIVAVLIFIVSQTGDKNSISTWYEKLPINLQSLIAKYIRTPRQNTLFPEKVRIVSEESVVIDAVEKVTPSVVTVGIVQEKPIIEFDPLDPWGFFRTPKQQGTKTEEADIGSGFVVSEDGLIVTNKHVVSELGAKYKVITSDNTPHDVTNIYRDPVNDIAILKINASGLKPVEMGDSSSLKVGQTVIALGTPLGEFRGSVTKGIISGIGRGITAGTPYQNTAEEISNVIQTDAAINPGNSGGPLVNSSAQVIGVNTAVASGAENIGFALPISIVKDAIDNFEKTGSFERPYLGVSYELIDKETSVRIKMPQGAYVQRVVPSSPADKAGIKDGDVILKINGKQIGAGKNETLAEIIATYKTGDEIELTIWRDGEELDVKATLSQLQE